MDVALAAIGAALVLASVYALGWGVGEGEVSARVWRRRRWVSAAAGVSVAYVFVDVLPELGAQNLTVKEALGEADALFAEQRVYVLALVSFVVIYGLEHMVLSGRERRRETIHLGGFAAYSALVGYLLVERAERGLVTLALYTLAMAVHFVIVNHSLAEEHGRAYLRRGHLLLAAGVIAGCAAGLAMPLSDVAFARLFALLAGGVVITSLKSELPDERSGRFWPFCLAALLFAVLLMLA
jgi:hypothetical protein